MTAALTLPTGVSLVAGTASDAIGSTNGATTYWSLGGLSGGSSRTVTVDVTLDCNSLGCAPADLAAIRAECNGTNSGETYARVASSNISLIDDSKATVTGLTAVDDTSNPDAPVIRANYTLSGGSGAATATLTRAIGDASPNATQVSLATEGAGTHTFDDGYAQSYQQTYFYRVSVTDGACTRTFGPLPVKTSSGQSSGFDGGLESNGRLSGALARRALARTTNASWLPTVAAAAGRSVLPTPVETLPFGLGAMATRSWDGTLRGAIPAAGPGDSHAVDVTPGDLPALTNAGQVASADYLDAGGRRLGTVLAVETLGTTYEHGKAICDRASGATLDRVDATALESGATLLRAAYRDGKSRTGDVATEFKIYANPDGSREAYASWLRDGYPAPRADQRVLNVQAWSAIPGYELALADATSAPHASSKTERRQPSLRRWPADALLAASQRRWRRPSISLILQEKPSIVSGSPMAPGRFLTTRSSVGLPVRRPSKRPAAGERPRPSTATSLSPVAPTFPGRSTASLASRATSPGRSPHSISTITKEFPLPTRRTCRCAPASNRRVVRRAPSPA